MGVRQEWLDAIAEHVRTARIARDDPFSAKLATAARRDSWWSALQGVADHDRSRQEDIAAPQVA